MSQKRNGTLTAAWTGVPSDDDPALPPERRAVTGSGGRWRRRRQRGERLMVPKAEFRSYYGLPVLNQPTWKAPDIAGYLFLGGLAGASSGLAAAAELTARPDLARAARIGAVGALAGSLYGLIHDLGRPARFVNMLRVFKVTSPMSVGSWLLAAYGPQATLAAASAVTGRLPMLGRAAGIGAGVLGVGVATYTAALISDTAVPVWHDGRRELPYLFAGSAAASAGGLGLLAAPLSQAGPASRIAVAGTLVEVLAAKVMQRCLGPVAEPLKDGPSGRLLRWGERLGVTGAVLGATAGRRSRLAAGVAGAALLVGSACTRFGLFRAGQKSAADPRYTVRPQREHLELRTDQRP
ncbi:NrfD/PsrC family molybdoenzyme membrane anchor subunit [Dactylosporangium aurantiacum]|uniref:NrfD/PsrC family molybdoenzyme membrane anchor subunit n=1 Tax=Dactylosporangium aurantiacum TaxID=35754 RepID=UPI000A6732DE|nr:NrfD/PsrC family molybdoenzyme membrane anchor subunit [Dactylosporangium aurantiacum]MDG6110334.1 polysulfide reductase NrfD [Dactylosporangium aurantiacum]